MQKHLALLALAAFTHAGAWAATYTYTGNPYDPAALHNFTAPCGVGNCGSFTPAMFQSGWFTTLHPLPAGLGNANIASLVTGFEFSDGLTTYSSAAGDFLYSAYADTAANGAFINADLTFFHWDTAVVQHGRVNQMSLHGFVNHNYDCDTVNVPGNGVCNVSNAGTSSSYVDDHPRTTGTWLVTGLPAPGAGVNAVPTLSEWGVLLLAGLMAGIGGWLARQRAP